jgi:hypothetical protein
MQTGHESAARRLHLAVEPVAQLGFAAYAHRRSCRDASQMDWYFGGRLACLGRVPAAAAVALLAVLEPNRVIAGVDAVWSVTDPEELIAARLDAVDRMLTSSVADDFDAARTAARLRRAADALEPAGHPLFAAWRARPPTGKLLGDLWLTSVALREHRGAAHIAAWRAHGLTPVEILVLTEAWTKSTIGSNAHVRMGWPETAVERAVAGLTDAGLLRDGDITDAGRVRRDNIERMTDLQEAPAIAALRDDLDVLCRQLHSLATAAAP